MERAVESKTNCSDMVNMEIINDGELLKNIRERYSKDDIYTYVGPTLLAVNPFKGVAKLFEKELKNEFISKVALGSGKNYKDLLPHAYAISAEAYRCLFENERN